MQNLVSIKIPEEFKVKDQEVEEVEQIVDIEDINKAYCSCKNCSD